MRVNGSIRVDGQAGSATVSGLRRRIGEGDIPDICRILLRTRIAEGSGYGGEIAAKQKFGSGGYGADRFGSRYQACQLLNPFLLLFGQDDSAVCRAFFYVCRRVSAFGSGRGKPFIFSQISNIMTNY